MSDLQRADFCFFFFDVEKVRQSLVFSDTLALRCIFSISNLFLCFLVVFPLPKYDALCGAILELSGRCGTKPHLLTVVTALFFNRPEIVSA